MPIYFDEDYNLEYNRETIVRQNTIQSKNTSVSHQGEILAKVTPKYLET